MSFKTELKLKGIPLSDKEIEHLKELAIKESRTNVADKVYALNEEGFFSALVMITALSRTINELMLGLSESKLKFKFKKDFKSLRHLTGCVYRQFEKDNKQNKELIKGFEIYSDEFNELVYQHIEAIEKNTRK